MLISAPPMGLGQTLDGVDQDGNLMNEDKLGMCHTFPANTLTGGPNRVKSVNTGRPVTAVLLRNKSGGVFYGKRLCQLERTAGYGMTKNANGYSTVLANFGVALIDPNLPSAGVASNDIFWGVISGPALCLLPLAAADHTRDIAVNDALVASTGTTTGATTSGRITHARLASNTAASDALSMAMGYLGRALSARTSQETTAGADLLVDFAILLFGENR